MPIADNLMLPNLTSYLASIIMLSPLACSLILDHCFAEFDKIAKVTRHPVEWFGFLINKVLQLSQTSVPSGRPRLQKTLGFLIILKALAIAYGTKISLEYLHNSNLPLTAASLEVFFLAWLISCKSFFYHLKPIEVNLKQGNLAQARSSLQKIVGRQCSQLTTKEIIVAACESSSENLSDGFIAPIFWYLAFGLPGVVFYKIINTADSMIGYQKKPYQHVGYASAKLDDALNYIPSRLTALIFLLLTRVPLINRDCKNKYSSCSVRTYSKNRTVTLMPITLMPMPELFDNISSDAKQHASPNSGWPISSFAFAFDVRLGGKKTYPADKKHSSSEVYYFNKNGQVATIDCFCKIYWLIKQLALVTFMLSLGSLLFQLY